MSADSDVISQPGITRVAFDGVGQKVKPVFTLNQRRRLWAALTQTDTSGTFRPDHKVVVKCNLPIWKRRRSLDPLGEGNETRHDSQCYKKKQLLGFTEQLLSVWHVCSARNEPQAQCIFITQHSIWAYFHIHVTLRYIIWGVQPSHLRGSHWAVRGYHENPERAKVPHQNQVTSSAVVGTSVFECGFIFIVFWWFSAFSPPPGTRSQTHCFLFFYNLKV